MGGGGHGIDAEIRVLQGAELALQKDRLSLDDGLLQILVGVRNIAADLLPPDHELVKQGLGVQGILVIEVDQKRVFESADVLQVGHKAFLVKQLIDLNAVFGVFVRVEGGDA